MGRDKRAGGQTDAPSALPALNPNQPTHNRQAPMKLSTRLCGFIGSSGISDPLAEIQRANQRGDARRDVHHRAAGEIEAGNLPPRKAFSSPPLPQTMCAIGK